MKYIFFSKVPVPGRLLRNSSENYFQKGEIPQWLKCKKERVEPSAVKLFASKRKWTHLHQKSSKAALQHLKRQDFGHLGASSCVGQLLDPLSSRWQLHVPHSPKMAQQISLSKPHVFHNVQQMHLIARCQIQFPRPRTKAFWFVDEPRISSHSSILTWMNGILSARRLPAGCSWSAAQSGTIGAVAQRS